MATLPADQGASPIRVLVVNNYKEFRELVCVVLGNRPNLQVVGEASDGSEAVSKAVGLKPDLILLDIRLPMLDGIEAARQIRELAPKSKIIFLSAETSTDSVQAAMTVGAWGYVLKLNAGTELLFAVDAVLAGRHFVSMELSGAVQVPERKAEFPSLAQKIGEVTHCHEAQFCSDEGDWFGAIARFVEKALRAGNPTIVIATESHETVFSRPCKNMAWML